MTNSISSAPTKLAYTIDEAAAASGIGRTSNYEKIRDGSLPSRVVCGRRHILSDDLRDFLAGREPNIAV